MFGVTNNYFHGINKVHVYQFTYSGKVGFLREWKHTNPPV